MYYARCTSCLFLPSRRDEVKTMVADGHSKLRIKCEVAPMKRTGRPHKHSKKLSKDGNGWFFICDPVTGRILQMTPMVEPEGNAKAT